MNILVIDNDPKVVTYLKKYLEAKNYEVISASNEEEAWNILQEKINIIDLIILEFRLPISEFQLLVKIRELASKLKIIFITSDNSYETMIDALRHKVEDLLLKPIDTEQLRITISKIESHIESKNILNQILPCLTGKIHYSLPSKVNLISICCKTINSHIKNICLAKKIDLHKISLCVQEAMANAVIHGNLEISSEIKVRSWDEFDNLIIEREGLPFYSKRNIEIECEFNFNQLKFTITDEGNGFNREDLPKLDDSNVWLNPFGRGIIIIQSYMDDVEWNEKGNQITLTKNI